MRTAQLHTAHDLGEAVGRIAGLAAMSLHESFPHLNLDRLIETFTRDTAIEFIGRRYLAAIARGKTPGEAASEAGVALLHAWAAARLEACARLDREKVSGDMKLVASNTPRR